MEKTHERIRQLRENHKETQQTVAAYLNISQWQYAACESGTYEWRPEHIKKICLRYHVSADYILGVTMPRLIITKKEGCKNKKRGR